MSCFSGCCVVVLAPVATLVFAVVALPIIRRMKRKDLAIATPRQRGKQHRAGKVFGGMMALWLMNRVLSDRSRLGSGHQR